MPAPAAVPLNVSSLRPLVARQLRCAPSPPPSDTPLPSPRVVPAVRPSDIGLNRAMTVVLDHDRRMLTVEVAGAERRDPGTADATRTASGVAELLGYEVRGNSSAGIRMAVLSRFVALDRTPSRLREPERRPGRA